MLFNTHGALAVSGVLMAATSAVAKDFKVLPRAPAAELQGCYSKIPGYGKAMSWTFQSSGWCLDHCAKEYATFALTGGSDCVCGNTLPPASAKVSSDKCSKSCSGWPDDMCGGTDYYSIYTTNLIADVPTYEDDTKSTTTTTSSGSKTTTTDGAASTASTSSSVRTETATSEASASGVPEDIDEKSAKSKNTAAIAAGVVIGVVGFAALCGAVFFWWRSKKNKAGAAGGATGGYGRDSGPPSMSDSRFDGDYMAQRRQSNGSIDDDHDFSRRILQVTNPDR
ncbi:Carbohydrate-binding WSC, subgroup [Penicillium griseofulvum]|uniref:Carbohydrate-binding WSC, subgroup n=1 Tax=Penicillium patulum TaxID=5078 RepID=A0A135LVQ7_PENPA|nr:Carbohydrate-binding WSC, subgroup [Penicillium griseofulvum]KXG53058.1 Carbohydrate-binding WSC, subgroup [Penicillium griseofulvum]